jgi:hypothetical protein
VKGSGDLQGLDLAAATRHGLDPAPRVRFAAEGRSERNQSSA